MSLDDSKNRETVGAGEPCGAVETVSDVVKNGREGIDGAMQTVKETASAAAVVIDREDAERQTRDSDLSITLAFARDLITCGDVQRAYELVKDIRFESTPMRQRLPLMMVVMRALVGLGRKGEAENLLEELLKQGVFDEVGIVFDQLAHLYRSLGDFKKALYFCDRSLEEPISASQRHSRERHRQKVRGKIPFVPGDKDGDSLAKLLIDFVDEKDFSRIDLCRRRLQELRDGHPSIKSEAFEAVDFLGDREALKDISKLLADWDNRSLHDADCERAERLCIAVLFFDPYDYHALMGRLYAARRRKDLNTFWTTISLLSKKFSHDPEACYEHGASLVRYYWELPYGGSNSAIAVRKRTNRRSYEAKELFLQRRRLMGRDDEKNKFMLKSGIGISQNRVALVNQAASLVNKGIIRGEPKEAVFCVLRVDPLYPPALCVAFCIAALNQDPRAHYYYKLWEEEGSIVLGSIETLFYNCRKALGEILRPGFVEVFPVTEPILRLRRNRIWDDLAARKPVDAVAARVTGWRRNGPSGGEG